MIVSLAGTLAAVGTDAAVVDVHGVGYQVFLGPRHLAQLPAVGSEVRLATHLVHREDAMLLFGFASAAERELFLQLTSVGGVGAKTGQSILSALGPEEVLAAIAAQDAKRLARAPGVGKKTAERIILELREKLTARRAEWREASGVGDLAPGGPGLDDEAELALLALGFTPQEARDALSGLPAGLEPEEAIRRAIARLSG